VTGPTEVRLSFPGAAPLSLREALRRPIFWFAAALGLPFGGFVREVAGEGLLGRFTLQDAAFLLLVAAVAPRIWALRITGDVALAALLNAGIVLSVLGNATGGWGEAAVHLYLLFFYLVLRDLLTIPAQRTALLVGLLAAFALALAAAVAAKLAPNPLMPQNSLHLQGTFLNGSQYGSFVLVVSVPFLAFVFGRLLAPPPAAVARALAGPTARAMTLVSVLTPPLILFSSKRTALVSLAFSLACALGIAWRRRAARTAGLLLAVGAVTAVMLTIADHYWGSLLREGEYFLARLDAGFAELNAPDSFFWSNLNQAWQRFLASPLLGSGYGALGLAYGGEQYETHSTYFKWLGDGGLATALPGLGLVFVTARGLWRGSRSGPAAARTDRLFLLVFFLGLAVAMLYNYLPRRREFWVVLALLNALAARPQPDEGGEGIAP
jgi:hypothetical protein